MDRLQLSLHSRSGYHSGVDATVSNVFGAAAFRMGHSQVSDGFQPVDQ